MLDGTLLDQLLRCRGEGIPAALATVVRTRGHCPQAVGATMLVLRDGRTFGTVGGGCGESEVRLRALTVIDEGLPALHQVSLVPTPEGGESDAAVCGGVMTLFIERVAPKQEG